MRQDPANSPSDRLRTRLAPSPTGALHLGNARTFLINWALARAGGWQIVMRIEDLDTPRIKAEAQRQMLDDLAWLGLDWDVGPFVQSHDRAPYETAMRALTAPNAVCAYSCVLSRKEIEQAASAPHAGDHETHFPESLRPSPVPSAPFDPDADCNWRFVVKPGEVVFEDQCLGTQRVNPAASVGDFVIWTRRALPSYQLAVVVDDAAHGVNQIVRGADLVDSTGRQILLQRALGLPTDVTYTHVPLVIGADGRRLAKRHGDTRINSYRQTGVPPEAIVGLIAYWSGVQSDRTPMEARDFEAKFRLATMSTEPAVLTEEDDRWLRSCSRS